jgi:hypothetical protein
VLGRQTLVAHCHAGVPVTEDGHMTLRWSTPAMVRVLAASCRRSWKRRFFRFNLPTRRAPLLGIHLLEARLSARDPSRTVLPVRRSLLVVIAGIRTVPLAAVQVHAHPYRGEREPNVVLWSVSRGPDDLIWGHRVDGCWVLSRVARRACRSRTVDGSWAGGAKCNCRLPNGSEYAGQDLSVRGG